MILDLVGCFYLQKNYLLLMLELINVYEVVVFMYILCRAWVFWESVMLSRKVNARPGKSLYNTFTDLGDS